jgi:hypothetical protein
MGLEGSREITPGLWVHYVDGSYRVSRTPEKPDVRVVVDLPTHADVSFSRLSETGELDSRNILETLSEEEESDLMRFFKSRGRRNRIRLRLRRFGIG